MAEYEFSDPIEVDLPIEPEDSGDEIMPSGEPVCKVCGVELTYSGRGRKPSYCADHKPAKNAGPKNVPANSNRASGGHKLRQELLTTFNGLGMMTLTVDKFDGATIIASAPQLAETLAQMAEHYPEFGKFLKDGNKSMVWVQLAVVMTGLVVPILAHHGAIPIDEKVAFERFHGKVKVETP